MHYIISLDLTDKSCVVVGGGTVAARKVSGLLAAGAVVTVISPTVHDTIPLDRVTLIQQPYDSRPLIAARPLLVFAATDSATVNAQVATDARAIGAWVNGVDAHTPSDFDNVVTLDRPPIQVAVSTSGAAPALAKHLRDEIGGLLGTAYPTLAAWMGELRPTVQAALPDPAARHAFWEHILASDVIGMLKSGDIELAYARFRALVDDLGHQP